MKFAEQYSYNEDGSVRGEFVTKEHGVIPLSFSAKMFGIDLAKMLKCDKRNFRGLLLGIKHVNNDGVACDVDGNPLESEDTYTPLPGKEIEKWDQHIYISRSGESAVDDEEYAKLSTEDQSLYRKVDCMEVELATGVPIRGPIYLCKEAAEIMSELFTLDVSIGDPIIKRYQFECQHSTTFAAQFGFLLKVSLEALEAKLSIERMARDITSGLFGMFASCVCPGSSDDADGEDDKNDEESGSDASETENAE